MTTTTIKLIRDQQISVIEALTPASLAGKSFREYASRQDFREWAEENSKAALRRFFIEDEFAYDPPLSSNMDSEEVMTGVIVTIAYPHDGRYGKGERKSAADVMREDMHQIDDAIGLRGYANYVGGQSAAIALTKEIDKGENIDFITLSYEVNFRRTM